MADKMVWFLNKEELKKMQHFAINGDFSTFRFSGILVIVFQLMMLLLITINRVKSIRAMLYTGLYLYLIIATLICIFLLDRLRKNTRYISVFYVVVKIYLFLAEAWAIGITVLGCQYGNDTSTFAYTVLACVAVIPIQPIYAATITVFSTIILNIVFLTVPGIHFQVGMMIQTISTCLLAILISVSSFTMRVRRNRLIFAREDYLKKIEELNAKLEDEVEKDGLTGLYNRRFLTKHIDQKLMVGEPASAVLMLDIDNFKSINDLYGHQNGDECLRTIAQETKKCILNRPGYAVRYGGEEFLIFFEYIKKDELQKLAEELRMNVERLKIELNTHTHISCTISVGYKIATEGLLFGELINEADLNMYRAKESGRNRVCGL